MPQKLLRPTKAHAGLCLTSLPIEVIEHVCRFLSTSTRVALASCCRALLGLNQSVAVWGELQLDTRAKLRLRSPSAHTSHVARLAAWLARRRGALRSLTLQLVAGGDAAALLPALAGSPLTTLRIHSAATSCSLSQLPPLPALAALLLVSESRRGSASIHVQALSSLPALSSLTIVTGAGEGLECPASQLPATLQALHINGALSSELSACLSTATQLRQLGLRNTARRDMPCFDAATFAGMAGLTALALGRCEVDSLAQALLDLTALVSLDLRASLGDSDDAAQFIGVLAGRSACLTRLGIAQWGLDCLPQQLSVLTALRELQIDGNRGLGGQDGDLPHPASFQPLSALVALTRLVMARCGLHALPSELQALVCLQWLDVCGNPLGGAKQDQGGMRALQSLAALTRIDLDSCRLGRLPAELRQLPELKVVWAAQNFLDDDAEEALPPRVQVLGLEDQDDAGDPDFPAAAYLAYLGEDTLLP